MRPSKPVSTREGTEKYRGAERCSEGYQSVSGNTSGPTLTTAP